VKLRLLPLVAGLSLIVLFVSLLMWFRSNTTADYLAHCRETGEIGLLSSVGRLILYHEVATSPFHWKPPFGMRYESRDAPASIIAYMPPNSPRHTEWLGFGMISGDNGRIVTRVWMIPHWFLALLSSVLPIIYLRHRRIRSDGLLCQICGYDLRGTPARCPECGTLVKA